jgi:hypothetical protein
MSARLTALLLPMLLVMQGCDVTATPVSRVMADPFRYQGRSVSVRGVVGWSGEVPLVGRRGFTLEQDEAKLLVLSDRPAPPIGTSLKVAGHFEASFDLGEHFAPVLLDEDPGPRRDGGASDVR